MSVVHECIEGSIVYMLDREVLMNSNFVTPTDKYSINSTSESPLKCTTFQRIESINILDIGDSSTLATTKRWSDHIATANEITSISASTSASSTTHSSKVQKNYSYTRIMKRMQTKFS